MNTRIGISGIGIVSPLGIGREAFWSSLASGKNGVSEVNLFDRAPLTCRLGAPVVDFDATKLIGPKGLRYVDRGSRFAIAASRLALEDAGLPLTAADPHKLGIVLGTAFGGFTSQQEFNRERVLEGPKWVSPMKFPNTPINAPSYQIPIRYQMRLVNVTLSSGMNSSLDAIRYGVLKLRRTPEAAIVCGGIDELSFLAYYSCYFSNELAGLSGEEVSCPFDRRRNGYVLGEGCALMVLEALETLKQRDRKALAEVRGHGSAFAPRHADVATRTRAVAWAMRMAIENAQVRPDDIQFIAASANSSLHSDVIEARAIGQVFSERAASLPVSAIKSMTGEAFGASGAMQVAAAILALKRDILPPTINTTQLDPECHIDCVRAVKRRADVHFALVNSIDRYGSVVSLVLGRGEN